MQRILRASWRKLEKVSSVVSLSHYTALPLSHGKPHDHCLSVYLGEPVNIER
jgi:hypothetical protein